MSTTGVHKSEKKEVCGQPTVEARARARDGSRSRWGALAEQGEAGLGPLPCQCRAGAIAPAWVSLIASKQASKLQVRRGPTDSPESRWLRASQKHYCRCQMLAPSVQITLTKKKELIQAVKAGCQPKERRAIARRFLQENGIAGTKVVVEVLKKSSAVERTMTGEDDVLEWLVRVASNGNKKRRVSLSTDSPKKRANRGSK